jgi:hypothetical protein
MFLVTEMCEISYTRVNVNRFRWFIWFETGVFVVIFQCNLTEMKAYSGFKQGFFSCHSVVQLTPKRVRNNQ